LKNDRRAGLMTEFAIVGPIFFILIFMVFDFAYNAFSQAALDSALQATARQIQVGQTQATGAAQATTEALLVSNYMCPNAIGLLNCNNIYIRVESIDQTACPGGVNAQDLWYATDGSLPLTYSGNIASLNLTLYGGSGTGYAGPTNCQNASSTSGFCVAGPSINAPVLIVLSAVYVQPSFLGRLVPNTVSYNGNTVRAQFSSAAFITEGFVSQYTPTNGSASTC
jgi:hypothetical protein